MNNIYNEALELDMLRTCLKGVILTLYVGFIVYLVLKKMGMLTSNKLKRF
jgi:hypothetical protein